MKVKTPKDKLQSNSLVGREAFEISNEKRRTTIAPQHRTASRGGSHIITSPRYDEFGEKLTIAVPPASDTEQKRSWPPRRRHEEYLASNLIEAHLGSQEIHVEAYVPASLSAKASRASRLVKRCSRLRKSAQWEKATLRGGFSRTGPQPLL